MAAMIHALQVLLQERKVRADPVSHEPVVPPSQQPLAPHVCTLGNLCGFSSLVTIFVALGAVNCLFRGAEALTVISDDTTGAFRGATTCTL